MCVCVCVLFSRVWLFATPWTIACQTPLSMGLSGKNTRVSCHSLSRGSFWPRDRTLVSCIAGSFLTVSVSHGSAMHITSSNNLSFGLCLWTDPFISSCLSKCACGRTPLYLLASADLVMFPISGLCVPVQADYIYYLLSAYNHWGWLCVLFFLSFSFCQ